ncbi:ribonuclease III [Dietzia alimentaria]|uniref:ribonuclease III n=1 Tax=Dietzia alimentaria TaxID=665550 RepID=UPI000299D243|nr:ribonuclease III [Dietzia alimentaria]
MTGSRSPLDSALGVELPIELATQALTHRSYAYEHGGLPHNERLEFLGDAVLELVVTEYLYSAYPDRPEGDLAKIRASLVNTYVLADIARELGDDGLGAHLRLGRGEELTGGNDKHSILADTLEAVFGAVYLTHGLETARRVIEAIIGERLQLVPTLGAALDWKTSLQEKAASIGRPKARYEITSTGPDHDKTFSAVVFVGEDSLGQGTGRTKKEAEQKAAEQAWAVLDKAKR